MARGRVVSEGSVQALRAGIARKRVWCATALSIAELAAWPEVAKLHDIVRDPAEDRLLVPVLTACYGIVRAVRAVEPKAASGLKELIESEDLEHHRNANAAARAGVILRSLAEDGRQRPRLRAP